MAHRNKRKLVYGVGVNDVDYPVTMNALIAGLQKQIWRCPIYNVWNDMLRRCYNKKFQVRRPTYIGCTVVPEWHSFMAFRAWMMTQSWEGAQLDKDILFPGNKVYSPETCVFIPQNLNAFLTDHGAKRGDHPIGVAYQKPYGKYRAQCNNPFTGRRGYIGLFHTAESAHEAWRSKKHEHALRYADMQTDPRIADALRRRYSKNG